MNGITFYPAGNTAAVRYAAAFLAQRGLDIADQPCPEVTHLLLPVPSFDDAGRIKGGGDLVHILNSLPQDVTVMGGKLEHPALSGCRTVDFLKDPWYLAENAAITAENAIGIVINNLPVTLNGCPVLIIGWGRIGKCLAFKLKALGAEVTVAARSDPDRGMLQALGYRAIHPAGLSSALVRYRVLINTAPAPILTRQQTAHCRPDCIKIDLASTQGIEGDDVIQARGLPGQETPESSGQLIARTAIRLAVGKGTLL